VSNTSSPKLSDSGNNQPPQTIYLKNYAPPDFLVDQVDLTFNLDANSTTVKSYFRVDRNPAGDPQAALRLDGHDLELLSIRMDGESLSSNRYVVDDSSLTITDTPDQFDLEIETLVNPTANTSLSGLYQSGGMLCTQCEAEGFRKITYFFDRPDVMACYRSTLIAKKTKYPVLLSNGNSIKTEDLDDGYHRAVWDDPFPKPSYLFALVAGDLAHVEDSFVTESGRTIPLRIYTEPRNVDKCDHAMDSLKSSMAWDEKVYGLEYDLDVFNIVAVEDFNMGAMENKGLNVFNAKFIVAKPETATDLDYEFIEGVVAHEYFHNWTGNRVTCRDWFQLSLKEGLTVFRDQQFSADMGSAAVRRIGSVRALRTHQFPEDAGPMAHPIRPQSYIEINNFYTATVYEKGAEVVRMIHTLLGPKEFRKGMDLYFERHDGQAVTTDDFVSAMEDASGADLSNFRIWYEQAGTPELAVSDSFDASTGIYTLNVAQSCPNTPGQTDKKPFHIPLAIGLMDPDSGVDMPVSLDGESGEGTTTRILDVKKSNQSFRFSGLSNAPIPSLLRGFSAPVKLVIDRDDQTLAFGLANDSDPFNRWEAGQAYASRVILRVVADLSAGREPKLDQPFIEALGSVLTRADLDPALIAEILTVPSEAVLGEQMTEIDVQGVHDARHLVRQWIARGLEDELVASYDDITGEALTKIDGPAMAQRHLRNTCLEYLVEIGKQTHINRAFEQFEHGGNMTNVISALKALSNFNCEERQKALAAFEATWSNDPLVLDKWFSIQATSRLAETPERVIALMNHSGFDIKNPNRVRALLGAFFMMNLAHFHASDGAGYAFFSRQVLALDALNPQVAARMMGAIIRWRRYDSHRQTLMKAEIEKIIDTESISRDVYELAAKSLDE
jgi:aminopeptidase N